MPSPGEINVLTLHWLSGGVLLLNRGKSQQMEASQLKHYVKKVCGMQLELLGLHWWQMQFC
jgi:hypothetical protein